MGTNSGRPAIPFDVIGSKCIEDALRHLYTQGVVSPRYPVPAIPLEARWWHPKGNKVVCVIMRKHHPRPALIGWWQD